MLLMPDNSNLDWNWWMEEVLSLAQTDRIAAMAMATYLLPKTEALYGAVSKETMIICHQLGILAMLTEKYNEAESYLLKAMELRESLSEFDVNELSDIAKHLTLLYEAKARTVNEKMI